MTLSARPAAAAVTALACAAALAAPLAVYAQKPDDGAAASMPSPGGQLDAATVVAAVTEGLRTIHADQGTPNLVWPSHYGASSACGPLPSSAYCPSNHTVYIAREDAEISYSFGDAALAYVVAHEYAHAMQNHFGVFNPDTRSHELEADCLAGYYLAAIPNVTFDEDDVYEIRDMAIRVGDYDFMHPNHHGTPDDRVHAVVDGIMIAVGEGDVSACVRAY